MSYQIINNGPSLKIIYDGQELSLSKRSIQEVVVIREDVIKIDTGDSCNSFYIRSSQVVGFSVMPVADLIYQLNTWITECACCNCNDAEEDPGPR